MPGVKVFISYSREDAEWVKRLRTHLAPLLQDDQLDLWDDSKIQPGDDWRAEIRAALDSSSAAILLISPDFVASDFIRKNELLPLLEAAEKQGKVILPIHVRPSYLKGTPLERVQSFNTPDQSLKALPEVESDALLVKVAERVDALIAAVSTAPDTSRKQPDAYADARRRIRKALRDPRYEWRTVRRLAVLGGVTTKEALEILRAEKDVRLGEKLRRGARVRIAQLE